MFAREYSGAQYPLRVVGVSGARLATGGGVVFAEDGRLVMETLWDEQHYARDFTRPRRLPPPTRVKGTHASIISLWCDNYFHWIFNALPRLAVLEASGVEYDSVIVPERLSRFQRESLDALGIDESRCTPFSGEHLAPERLIWCAPLTPINEPTTFALEWLRQALAAPATTPDRMLYLSRLGASRSVTNEREVLALLEPLGFECVRSETLSFREQMDTFASAKMLVGPHGANFVNGIFAAPCSVLEFFQPAHVNWAIYTTMCAAGHDHWHLICDRVTRRGRRKLDDMRVPLGALAETIETMLDEPQAMADAAVRL